MKLWFTVVITSSFEVKSVTFILNCVPTSTLRFKVDCVFGLERAYYLISESIVAFLVP